MSAIRDEKLKRVLTLRHTMEETSKNMIDMNRELMSLEKELFIECGHDTMNRKTEWVMVSGNDNYMSAKYKCTECGYEESMLRGVPKDVKGR